MDQQIPASWRRRCIARQIVRLSLSLATLHCAISSIRRQQPLHSLDWVSIWQTPVQGVGTGPASISGNDIMRAGQT